MSPRTNTNWYNDKKNCDLEKNPRRLTSIQILMEWLTVPENFQKYRGVNQSKRTVLSTLSQIFEEMGFNYRSPSVIRNKIDTILQSYVRARDYIRGTGQGNFPVVIDSKDADNNRVLQEKKLEEETLKICKEYYEIHPLYGDSASAEARPSRDSDDENVEEIMTNGGMKIRDRDYSSGDKEEYGARDIESDYEYVDSSEKTATTTPEPVTPRSAPAGPVPDTQSQASATTSSQKTNGVKRKGKQNKTVYEMIESANEERALKRQLLEREFEWKQMIDAREEARSMADMKHRALERNRDKGLELLNIYKNDKTITLQEYFEESKAVMEKYYFESFKFIE